MVARQVLPRREKPVARQCRSAGTPGASLEIVIAPAWYQTRAFVVMSIIVSAMIVWVAYRLRMRQVAHALSARFDERLVERTRMARDLHDTLLQTLQGTKMVADTALDRPDDAPALARALKQVSTWIGQASEEGRSAVNALRTSTTEGNDLAEAFRGAIEDSRRQSAIGASIAVTGSPREMHPVVRNEVYRIGYEAIRNAYTHSHANHLEIALGYGRDLTLRVADDGIGMDPPTAEHGRDGHFGLPGMRERAGRIGAALSVSSAPGAGTMVVLSVPGRAIFKNTSSHFAGRLWSRLSGTDETLPPHEHRG
jgi:signal transduction histidine kinase